VAPSCASIPIHLMMVRPQLPTDSDEGRVATCIMLGTSPTVSHSASSSSDSFGLKSIMASPPPIPAMVISVVLSDISEVLEVESTPRDDVVQTGPHTETSVGEFFLTLTLVVQVVVAEVMAPPTLSRLFRGGRRLGWWMKMTDRYLTVSSV
jgi:hypothetical protein